MILIKKVDVEEHFAERRAMRLGRMQPLGQLGAAWIKSATRRKRVPAPAGALTPELSAPTVSAASIPTRPYSVRSRLLRPPASLQQ